MSIIVQKYGGSSLADVPALQRVADSIVVRQSAGHGLVVVVSAMGKVTDQLIEQARQVSPAPHRRELDMLVTAGERMTMALLSMALDARGVQAISFTGSQSGIITDAEHQGARILEVRPERLQRELRQGRIVIVAGYQGVSREREVTTLGRGGSDTTAVALAAALNAEVCEIYSDVDGVYSADPNVCPQARLLAELPFATMQTMAGSGARVLNADAVEFARLANITIEARRTGDPSDRHTRVYAKASTLSGVVAVVGAASVSLISGDPTTWTDLFWADLAGIGGRVFACSTASALVDRTGIPGGSTVPLSGLAAKYGVPVVAAAAVTIVGNVALAELAPKSLACLREHEIGPLDCFGVPGAFTWAVCAEHAIAAVNCLHARFVESRA